MSDPLADVAPADPAAYRILAEAGFGPDLFDPTQHRCCALLERYASSVTLDVCASLGVLERLDVARTVPELLGACGLVQTFAPRLAWLLARLELAGVVTRAGDRYRLAGPPPASTREVVRTAGLALDPSYAPAYELLDVAADLYPRVARGEAQPERALFMRVGLWVAYFSNANRYYALSNVVAARAAAARFGGGRILEVGAGLGSATAALCDELRASGRLAAVESYRATEPVPFFRRRAERALAQAWPDGPLVLDAFDLNHPWEAQDVAPGSCALLWGVNVFHLAHRLDDVLAEAYRALAPGGWLVVGEGVRPAPGEPVGAELPFQLLDGLHDVELHPVTRPTAGFLTADIWEAALRRAGFAPVEVVPDLARLRPHYAGFLGAAFCGRRSRPSSTPTRSIRHPR
jgi:SAM-dependent methyltransferase